VTGDATHAALGTVGTDPRVTLVTVEAPAERLGDDVATVGANLQRLPGVVGCLEVPRNRFDRALDFVSEGGWHAAKYRMGGVHDDDVPNELELVGFVVECIRRALPFKLTAGLHHAVAEGLYGDGPRHHGLLNVMAAVSAAQAGASHELVSGFLATQSPDALASDVSRWSDDMCVQVRSSFRSFGCCGVTHPIDDLAKLGLIEKQRP
jgi:hypothetical protein